MSIRDLVRDMQRDIRDTDLEPARARELLAKLTACIGNCNPEIREADMDYHRVLLQCLDSEAKANRAKIRSQVTPEYARMREARDTLTLVVELVRSLKVILRGVEEEMRLSR